MKMQKIEKKILDRSGWQTNTGKKGKKIFLHRQTNFPNNLVNVEHHFNLSLKSVIENIKNEW